MAQSKIYRKRGCEENNINHSNEHKAAIGIQVTYNLGIRKYQGEG